MDSSESTNLYEALRQMEESSEPFSISWCKYSEKTGKGGEIVTSQNVLFAGKRETEDYELLYFKNSDNEVVCCHIYSLMFYNNKKLIIE